MMEEDKRSSFFDDDRHLVVHCGVCDWRMRCTPAEASEIFGEYTSVEEARRMVKACPRCGATGIGDECKIDVRPCMSDYYAVCHYKRDRRTLEKFPDDRTAQLMLESHRLQWERRRPREHGSFEIRLTAALVGRPANSPRFTFRGSSFRAEALHA
jgi:hypothetical protein